MTARPLDATGQSLRLLILLRRYENTLAGQSDAILAEARDLLVRILERQDLTVVSSGRVQARLVSITTKADDVLLAAYQRLNAEIRESLVAMARTQTGAIARLLADSAPPGIIDVGQLQLPTRAQLRSIVTTEPVRGAVMWDWWKRQRIQTRQNVLTQMRIGLAGGESIDELVRRVRGRALGGGRYEGGVLPTSMRNAGALVRTMANHVANNASLATYRENADLTQSWEWVTALDERVCPICAPLDGKTFANDDPQAPILPAHWNCRCTRIPVLDHRALGIRPPAQPRETYEQWLRRQDPATQIDILGPARAALYQARKVSLGDLVRQDGSRVTLEQLSRILGDTPADATSAA